MRRTFFAFAVVAYCFIASPVAAEVKLDALKLPAGYEIAVWAEVDGARSLAVGDGFVIVGSMGKQVSVVPFDASSYAASQPFVLADNLKVPNGVALVGGVLHIAEQHRVVRWGDAPFDIANPAQTPLQVGPNLPDKAWHGWRSIAEGPDGRVYVTLGSPCNICTTQSPEGSVVAMNPDGSDFEVYASGIRQSVGLAFHPVTRALYFTDNNADWMGDNAPPGEMNRADAPGQHFGFPYYGGGKARTKEFLKETPPADVQFPVVEFQAHTANLGFRFYQGEMFPSDVKGDAIVAQHGSWNRRVPIGYRLMRVRFGADNNPVSKEVFVDGWLRRGRSWGRPVDVKELPDGSLLVSDDTAGVIYRITYQAP